jgi:hypothetical protein
MDTRTIAIVAAMMTVAGAGQAQERHPVPADTVIVCMGIPVAGAGRAQSVASELFARIGVRIDWRNMNHCPDEAIRISLQTMTEPGQLPGALAYALPYEKVHIRVFYDRVRTLSGATGETNLLGHVLAHEIAHILQGVVRHSETGLMKAQWNQDDRFRMCNRQMSFTRLDAELIYKGLERRAGGRGPAPQTAESNRIVGAVSASGL